MSATPQSTAGAAWKRWLPARPVGERCDCADRARHRHADAAVLARPLRLFLRHDPGRARSASSSSAISRNEAAMAEIRVEQSAQGLRRLRRRAGLDLHGRGRRRSSCMLGPSGCGKTTTLRMIAGLELPTEGRILLDGEDVTLRARRGARHRLRLPALRALSAHERRRQHRLPAEVPGRAARRDPRGRSQETARLLRIDHLLDEPVSGLSGGDRQRVALGRAIVRRPKAFLMDEPLGRARRRVPPRHDARSCATCTTASARPPSTSPTTSSRRCRWPTRSRS